ncbi:unnamed protein product [Somion occarium]|uniref:Galactose oxidase n=1 Tax=Somion occarium TaxID=3059160 RepID=A0ABP1D1S8_9APHY
MLWPLFPIVIYIHAAFSQEISTNTPVPPLQWINLTPLLGGSAAPPPLKDASIGYDDTSRNVIIFGGESSQGFPQSSTYLLNLDTLTWHSPSPPTQLQGDPPARAGAISGIDFAASYRHSYLVAGGRGTSGPLNDVWEFDYNNEFWSQVQITGSSPSPRYGAVGGMDFRTPPIQSISLASPNNTYYLAGGFDGKNAISLSDVWRLNISGTLSSNNARDVIGSWEKIPFDDSLPGRTGMSGAVVLTGSQQHIVSVGGCHSSNAPRSDPALAANRSPGSSFGSQVYMVLGTYDSSLWDDGNGLNRGEVDILDIGTGAWARILPSGDPGQQGNDKPAFPTPREGAAAISFPQKLVGSNRNQAADMLVFGGRDASGRYLSEVWILRAYNATLTQSNQHWGGFGNGQLTGGTDATGAGVTIQYMTACATALKSGSTSGSPTATGTSPSQPTNTNGNDTPSPVASDLYDTSVIHKALAPVSIAILLPAIVLFRLSSFSLSQPDAPGLGLSFFFASIVGGIAAFGIGIGGLASAFTSITLNSSIAKRASSSLNLQTGHGRAGLALFVALYGVVPALVAISLCIKVRRNGGVSSLSLSNGRSRFNSSEAPEKRMDSPAPPTNAASEETSAADDRSQSRERRARSWSSFGWPGGRHSAGHMSEESVQDAAGSPSGRSFEVTNRPQRTRHASVHSLAAFAEYNRPGQNRNVSDGSWLDQRRSLTSHADGDYALNQLPPTPGTNILEMTSTRGLVTQSPNIEPPHMPPLLDSLIHILLHLLVIGLSILSLIALWNRAPKAGFAVFLAWTAVFYTVIVVLAWRGIPHESILSTFLHRLRAEHVPTQVPSRPLSEVGMDGIPFPSNHQGPYQHHQPPYRAVPHDGDYPTSSHGHDGLGVDDYDDGEDDETRQRRIEEEMSRREVSIVTVPRRKLYLTNPES